jgi:acyl-coenzyme A synthetase/AMP-(fatty) acid ligase
MSQFATSNGGRGGMRKPPLAFTEHGVIMAAAVLNSPRAIEVSVYVVRAFVQLRDTLSANAEIARRLEQLERKLGSHDRAILEILQALRQLTQPAEAPKRRGIGFVHD